MWAKPKINREQMLLFNPTLDDMIPQEHPVRFFSEILEHYDWHGWEKQHNQRRGQPPIHPKYKAGGILYGIGLQITSSRQLEDACAHRFDFMWLMHGHRIDHSTFAKFRTRNEQQLKDLFNELNLLVKKMGYITLQEVATDGTRILSDSSRHRTKSMKELQRWLDGIQERLSDALTQMGQSDEHDDKVFGEEGSVGELPEILHKMTNRVDMLEKAKQELEQIEQRREEKNESSPEKIAKIPVSDSDSRVLKNKEGGFAPNYTPVVTTDSAKGFIVATDVTNSTAESPLQRAAADEIKETFDEYPKQMMGDGLYTELKTIRYLIAKGIDVLAPVKSIGALPGSPGWRDDPTVPVEKSRRAELPVVKKTKRFKREAFIFDIEQDCFYCPMGKRLDFKCQCSHKRSPQKSIVTRVYKARKSDCQQCSLRLQCIPRSQKYRRVERMDNSGVMEEVAIKMAQQENKEALARRKFIAETPFAHIKHNFGIRRFRHRGLRKVRQEWRWYCIGYNLKKLVRLLQKERRPALLETDQETVILPLLEG